MRHHDLHMHSISLTPDLLKSYDCVIVATHHSAYDWQMIAENSQLVIDTRNALREVHGPRDHIVSA
jgi:UDP-N-acetyl-D-glucosamine dehydrogenase